MATTAKIGFLNLDALPVCLWKENPNRLVSLLEIMELFKLWDHQDAFGRLQNLVMSLELRVAQDEGSDSPTDDEKQKCIEVLSLVEAECIRLAVDSTELISFTVFEMKKGGRSLTNNFLNTRVKDIDFMFRTQCDKVKFFRLTKEESRMFDNSKLFGTAVADAFSSDETTYEIREAGSCLAFGRYTATVFHLMRVLEKGLKALANELAVPFTIPFDYLNWQNIIEQIEATIKNLGNLKPGKYKTDTLQSYAEVAKQFRYFKDAWRNSVAHSRETYDIDQARSIFRHVQEFMEDIVKLGLHE
jgi:hypothetical protein